MKYIFRTIVSAVLVSADQKILLGKVRAGGVYPDCWHIPGGGVDEGENKEEALVREVREELGLDISQREALLLSDQDTGEAIKTDKQTGEQFLAKMRFYVYQVNMDKDAKDINISLDDDLREYKWVSVNELKNFKHTPPSEKLFRSLKWLG